TRYPYRSLFRAGVEIELGGLDLEVGSLGQPGEVQREVVGREDLAERHGRGEAGHARDVACVDTEPARLGDDEVAEGVLPRARDDRHPVAVACRGDGDVGRAAPEVLAEGAHLGEAHAVLQRVEVDPRSAERDHLETLGVGDDRLLGHAASLTLSLHIYKSPRRRFRDAYRFAMRSSTS